MAGRVRDWPGGIRSLLEFLAEHEGAVRRDLLVAGLNLDHLGSHRLSWLDLAVFIQYAPRDSAVCRQVNGEESDWGLTEHLLASAVDALNSGNWQRQRNRHAPKPKPIKRPGSRKQFDPDEMSGSLGSGAIPMSEFKSWWDNN